MWKKLRRWLVAWRCEDVELSQQLQELFSRLSPNELREIREAVADSRCREMNARKSGPSVCYFGQTPAERFDELIAWLRLLNRLKPFEVNREVHTNTISRL